MYKQLEFKFSMKDVTPTYPIGLNRITYYNIIYYHLIYDFYIFLINYVEKLTLTKSDNKLLSKMKELISKKFSDNHNINNIHGALLTLLGAIKNYKKINNWNIKRKINIPNNFDFINEEVSIKEILKRLENGEGFINTNFLSIKTPDLFFKSKGLIRPNDDNLFFTFNIFHFHLPDIKTKKRTDNLFFVQLTNNCVNCLYVGNHNDINNYQKLFNKLVQLDEEFGNDIQLPINYHDLINRNRNRAQSHYVHPDYEYVSYAAQHLIENPGSIFNIILPHGLEIRAEDIKLIKDLGANIFTKDYHTTYTREGVNTYSLYSLRGILTGLSRKITTQNLNLSPNQLNNLFEYMMNQFINYLPVPKQTV